MWQSHPTTSGAGDPANSSYLQQWVQPAAGQRELGRWEGRAQGERRDTVTAPGELLSLYMQKQVGTVQASPAERHQRLLCLLPTPQHPPTPVSPWMGCHFSPGLHVKLQITFFIPFPRLLWLLVSANNGHPCTLCHPSTALLPLPQLSLAPAPLTAFSSIPQERDEVQSCLFLALNPALCCPEGNQEHRPTKAQHPNISP